MSADALISRLTKVRKMGADRWMACCPAHQDKSPSLSIREAQDGRVLVHCWVGCSVESILGAVGLDFDALFPEKQDTDYAPKERMPFSHREAMAALVPEVLFVAHVSSALLQGKPLKQEDHERLITAAYRLNAAHAYVEGL